MAQGNLAQPIASFIFFNFILFDQKPVKDQAIDWWTRYFASCKGSHYNNEDFLRSGLKPIKASFVQWYSIATNEFPLYQYLNLAINCISFYLVK